MKLIKIIFCVFFLCTKLLYAQLYDAQWVFAPNPSSVDFRNDTVINHSFPGFFNINGTSANICDTNGSLLFMTNGISVFDGNANILPNGDTLSPCQYTFDVIESGNGLNILQAALFIPKPGSNDLYYLFHFSGDTLNRPTTLYYSLLQDSAGTGKVVKKNVVFCKSFFRGGGMTACKHANGRDYWIVIAASDTSIFYKFLLTPDTIEGPFLQRIGPNYPLPFDNAYSKFSQDGSKYVTGCFEGLITVLDFDRCSGNFSDPVTIFNNVSLISDSAISGCGSVEVSPNDRFVYVSDRLKLVQHDLWSENIQDSVELYTATSGDHAQIDQLQLAPNGKLYATPWNGGFYFLHVVNNPDGKGDSCEFVYGGDTSLTEDDSWIPNMINYKLGPLIGSGCDTIGKVINGITNTDKNSLLRILPNPADKYVYVEMGMQGNYEFGLLNTDGQIVNKKQTPQVDIFDTERLSAGVYFIKAIDKTTGTEITTKKVVIAH